MSEALSAGPSFLLNGLIANPGPWLLILVLSAAVAFVLSGLARAPVRRTLIGLWALLPAVLPALWLATCDMAGETGGEPCFAPGFALALGTMALPVWLIGTALGMVAGRRIAGR